MAFSNELIELAIGHVSSRGKIVPYADIRKYQNESDELYRSLFTLEDHALENFTSIKDYKGKYKLRHIIFDIDKGDNSGDYTTDMAKQFVHTLLDMQVDPDHIQIWFSGRGFHIEIPDYFGFEPSEDLPQIVKRTLHSEFGNEIDNIYDKGRIIRVNYSLNKKSGLYKTPISIKEFDDHIEYEDIVNISKDYGRQDFVPYILPLGIKPIWNARINKGNTSQAKVGIQMSSSVPTSSNYVPHVVCIQKMRDVANDSKGRRHPLLLRMVNAWRRSGIDADGALKLSELAIPSLKVKEVSNIVNSVFTWEHNGYSCNDSVMSEFCDTKCRFYQNRNYGVQALSLIHI